MKTNLLKPFAAVAVAALAAANSALAHCPLCAAATAGGVAATRLLGVDDTVTGTFVGGFVVSTGLWFDNWLRKKKKGGEFLPFQTAIVLLLSVAFTILTFYMARLIGSPDPAFRMLGVDKLVLGTLVGTAVTLGAFELHKRVKAANSGKALVPFQGIVFTLVLLAVTGTIFYFMTRRLV